MADQPFLSVQPGPNAERQDFSSFQAFTAWLDSVDTYWQWLEEFGEVGRAVFQRITERMAGARHEAGSAAANLSLPSMAVNDQVVLKRRVQERFDALVKAQPWLFEGDALFQWIKGLKRDPQTAVLAMAITAILVRDNPTDFSITKRLDPSLLIDASLMLNLHQLGLSGRAEAELQALRDVADQMSKVRSELAVELQSLHIQALEQQAQHEAALKAVEGSRLTHVEDYKEFQGQRATQWAEFTHQAGEERQALVDSYKAHLQLEAPVTYWETKRKKHRNLAWITGSAMAAAMLAAGGVVYCKLPELAKPPLGGTGKPAAAAVAVDSSQLVAQQLSWDNLAHVGGLVLLTTLVVWGMRILMRVFLSHLHLEMDAAERTTMVTTYLALIKDGALAKDGESMKMVLTALFRPTGDGIVKDEGLPQIGIAELLSRSK